MEGRVEKHKPAEKKKKYSSKITYIFNIKIKQKMLFDTLFLFPNLLCKLILCYLSNINKINPF